MGVTEFEAEIISSIPPAKLFKAFVLDLDKLIPRVMPESIKSVETLKGDGGPGTIKLFTFGEGCQFKTVKNVIDVLDKENYTYRYSIVEGDVLMGILERISYEIKITASSDGGSVSKNTSRYVTKGDIMIDEDKIKEGKGRAFALFKAIEAYVLENPNY
ncbi:major strawberry allergen Fra a 1.06-like [Impatiens glandulifera]|uniref:major strawberry allergen Fra a 1.06-like n=1 Tax=Impatiens glandulifera TaxID=253017 RepID=UPI001FB1464D|nr:major strawberry allergen Fra a 1.06-like [Impatiens glandulifera]